MKFQVSFAVLMCAIFIWVVNINAVEYDENLIIYFDYEEFKGDIVPDMSGHGHDGQINGDVKQVEEGKRGKAAKFATGSFLDLDGPNIPADDIPTEAITVAAWINCEKTGDHHAIFNARASDSTWIVHLNYVAKAIFDGCCAPMAGRQFLISAPEQRNMMSGFIMLALTV